MAKYEPVELEKVYEKMKKYAKNNKYEYYFSLVLDEKLDSYVTRAKSDKNESNVTVPMLYLRSEYSFFPFHNHPRLGANETELMLCNFSASDIECFDLMKRCMNCFNGSFLGALGRLFFIEKKKVNTLISDWSYEQIDSEDQGLTLIDSFETFKKVVKMNSTPFLTNCCEVTK